MRTPAYPFCMKYLFFLLIGSLLAVTGNTSVKDSSAGYRIANAVPDVYQPVEQVAFSGLLHEHVIINLQKRLLQIDSAILLSGFVKRPGKQSWIGEHMGKFLNAASNSYRYSHDPAIKLLMDEMVRKYLATQLPDGYLGTYLPEKYWKSWDVWAHKYAMIGLMSYYSVTGDQKAVEAAIKVANLICRVFGDKPGQLDLNKAGYQEGMASGSILEPMIDLYRYTGNGIYLDFARYILRAWETETGPKIMSKLAEYGKVNKVANAKAYEMLSCFTGILKYYRLTGEKNLLEPMQLAWKDIVDNRLYITGTASSDEVFKDDHLLPADSISQMGEGCVTTTWIQFNEQLLTVTGEYKYADEIEKTVYNHLLAAQNPASGCVSFYTLLQGPKLYKCDDGMSCCLSSISRGISMIPRLIWGKIRGSMSVLMFEPGELTDSIVTPAGSKVLLQLAAVTDFPVSGNINYRVNASAPEKFMLQFRVPSWAANFSVTVNGVKQKNLIRDHFFQIDRTWGRHDNVKVSFDMPLQVISGKPYYENSIAFKRGPQVLSLDSAINRSWLPFVTARKLARYQLRYNRSVLPAGWIGKQAYQVLQKGTAKAPVCNLVPYADAGQLSTMQQVWISLINTPEK